jgi:hypothetical protein
LRHIAIPNQNPQSSAQGKLVTPRFILKLPGWNTYANNWHTIQLSEDEFPVIVSLHPPKQI